MKQETPILVLSWNHFGFIYLFWLYRFDVKEEEKDEEELFALLKKRTLSFLFVARSISIFCPFHVNPPCIEILSIYFGLPIIVFDLRLRQCHGKYWEISAIRSLRSPIHITCHQLLSQHFSITDVYFYFIKYSE